VSQEEITSASTAADTTAYDLLMTSNIPDTPAIKEMLGDETFGLVFNITNTNPMTNLEFDISEILGDEDAFNFGKPHVKFGTAYQFSDPISRLVHLPEIQSSSGKI
jgi:hypothetical protein